MWYFNLPANSIWNYFPDYNKLSKSDQLLLDFDEGYSTQGVALLDASYQALHKGFVMEDKDKKLDLVNIKPTIKDNYRFIRRYFHPLWSWVVLVIRLFTFHNPIAEILGFLSQHRVKRQSLYKNVYSHEHSYNLFKSSLVNSSPKVSVIIPTLNRYKYLYDALLDLERQTYTNFEVIVIDQSEPFDNSFYEGWKLDLLVEYQEEKALWLARNRGVKISKGEIICLTEDDVRLPDNWLENHLKCLDYFKADISNGVFFPVSGKIPNSKNFLNTRNNLLQEIPVYLKMFFIKQVYLTDSLKK